nr:PREDICTED: probable multidrug resistance-associated protein lethal(2)03659 [Linepithema humile]XP_012224797.1 PREDICTED: probable multidrug resistance-associated protein lethal(2)03659 [Linepithema humile]XP_012224798.1 PREDICTED: probable multidrug resistance-associated protein lethal(2)03659 [Linepithema humile]XP_012224799.1 PREDICTED: probable multidrug resistance-associated protein lethal(2)03659 [Linepithema humile]XP_012224800.1 PREDICTED: probable multidrug resistance-associated prot
MINDGQRKYPINPRQNANVFSLVTYWWTRKIFWTGYNKDLEESDLYVTLKQDRTSYLGEIIGNAWKKEVDSCAKKKNGSTPQLLRVLLRCFGIPFLLIGIGEAVMELFSRMYQPVLFASLLRNFSNNRDEWSNEVYYCAAGMILLSILDCFIIHYTMHCTMHIGLRIKIACTSLIYQKILKLSNSVLDYETSVGQMVNFLSSDITRLESSLWDLHYIWIAPIQVVWISYNVFNEVGWAGIIGMAVLLLFIPFQALLAKKMTPLTLKSAERSDDRLRLMNQVIAGLQVIKMYVWEKPFYTLVEKARKREMNIIKKYSILKQLALTLDCYVPRLCLFVTILAYVLFGNYINPEKVYLVTAYFNVLRNSMIFGFSMGLHQLVQALVSIRRLRKFMMHSEITKTKQNPDRMDVKSSFALRMINVNAKWHGDGKDDTLRNVNLTVAPGSFVAIVGQVGSGKSSLLQAILQELPLTSGSIDSCGRINYISQQPWIFASSVKQNILFGQKVDKSRYAKVIRVCQMESDICSFPHGDSTAVGERGINLSGGQRARINLARAIYKDADIYLLDDPLSAVDSHVSKRLIDDCICGYLKDKTRILVTHQLQYLQLADQIVVMNNGAIKQKGTFNELQALGLDFMKLLKTTEPASKEADVGRPESRRRSSARCETKSGDEDSDVSPVEMREIAAKGHLSRDVFFAYFKASKKPFMIAMMILIFLVNQIVSGGSDYFVAFWVNVESNSWHESDNLTKEFLWDGPLSRDSMIYIYSAMIVGIILLWQLQTIVYFTVCMWSSVNLHSDMFHSILRTTMYFYNTNPAGRILNRFARDINIVDTMLSMCIFDIIVIGLILITVVIMVIAVTPWLAIPTMVCTCIFVFFRSIYICTSRNIKRLEGTTRSPIFDHLGASLQGLTTIRAFNAEEILMADLCNHQDVHSSACFLFMSTSRAFGFYIDVICQLYIGVIIAAFTFFDGLAVVSNIGLIITQTMSLTMMLQWGIRQTAELESQLTSIERILEYSRLEEEPMIDGKPETKPPDDWPTKGLVEFKDVNLMYIRGGAHVLKSINFIVLPKEKIGIVGRTGAGKSSLINALFRLAYIEGEIRIDDVSTDAIALHDFRSKISIIPQEPFLFTGSLRRNLDPFDQFSDAVLWQALQDVELKETISDMAGGLDTKVSDEGSNFSVGQRQLLCLARAIVKNNRIMVLDEATANIDPYTDSLIQKTVKTKFVNCTVFTIAHRLNTIMDSDRIFVMDAGCLVEFDHPYILLQRKGRFYNMVQQTGVMAENLMDIAAKSFYEKDRPPSR